MKRLGADFILASVLILYLSRHNCNKSAVVKQDKKQLRGEKSKRHAAQVARLRSAFKSTPTTSQAVNKDITTDTFEGKFGQPGSIEYRLFLVFLKRLILIIRLSSGSPTSLLMSTSGVPNHWNHDDVVAKDIVNIEISQQSSRDHYSTYLNLRAALTQLQLPLVPTIPPRYLLPYKELLPSISLSTLLSSLNFLCGQPCPRLLIAIPHNFHPCLK